MYRTSLKVIAHITLLLLLGGWLSQAWAGQVKVAWNAPTTYTDGTPVTALAGYHLNLQDSAGGTQQVNVGNQTTTTLTGLTGGRIYTITVTALDTTPTGHESSPSNPPLRVSVPLAQPETATTSVGTSVTIPVLANDTDPMSQPLKITSVTQGAHGTVTITGTSVTYTPVATFVGTDSFTYTITNYTATNGQGATSTATVTVNVLAGNHPPNAVGDTASILSGTPVTIAVLANDADPDGNPLTILSVTQGAHGTVTIKGSSVIYTPVAGFVGTDSFTYTIIDGQGASSMATVSVNVLSGNHPPSAMADAVSIPAGTSVTIAVLTNDTDPDSNPLTITSVTQGAHGTVTRQTTSVTYTPAAAFVGTDSFTYTIADGQGASATATVTVTVLPDRAASLVAAYNFNEGNGTIVTDASGHGNTGTISGATRTTAGKFGNALVFNGTNARVTIPDAPALRLTTAMTLEAWVKPSRVTSAWQDVIHKGNNYFLEATSPSNTLPGGGGTFGTANTVMYGTAALAVNAWSHLALTYDGATLRLYVNGVQAASRAQTGSLTTSANPLQIGGDSAFGHYFQGTIDEVRIYNQALLPSEIQADLQTPVVRTAVAAYNFNEGSGTTVTDASGNGHTGAISGATWTPQGKFGNALTFNGVNNWVTVNDSSLLDLTTGMTLEAWVFPTSTTGVRDILLKEGANVDIYNLYARNGHGQPESNVFVGGTNRTAEGVALPANVWTHVAGTYDGATVRLYINGVQVASKAISGAIATSAGVLRIGGNSIWGEFFQGRIDEVRIYNQALSPSEIQADMITPIK